MMDFSPDEIEDQIELARVGFDTDLHRLLKKSGLSRKDLAKRVGVSQAYISKLMNGYGNYTLKTMAKLSLALDAVVEVRLARRSKETVRVLSYLEARAFDRNKRPYDAGAGEGEMADVIPISTHTSRADWPNHSGATLRSQQRA